VSSQSAKVADQVGQLLAAILERSPRSIEELAQSAGVARPQLIEQLGALESHGLVAVDADAGNARPGPTALRFARSDQGVAELIELARPSMRRLATESGETANLIMPHSGGTEAIAQIDGSHLLGITNWVGRPLGLHTTAAGKVFLAFGSATLPDGELEVLTPKTITDRARLDDELGAVRERGYATLVDELEIGLSAVAAPVRESGGEVVAVLCVSGATLRLAPQRLQLLGRVALEQANEISARLGYQPA
jgi:DNA-binding IclR family transcriptional regulator